MSDEVRPEYQNHVVEAIEAITLVNPDLRDRLNVAVFDNLLKLPDHAYGWKSKGQKMTLGEKLHLIAMHLKSGLVPGMGHAVYFDGQFYVTTAGARYVSDNNPNWKVIEAKFQPHTPEERAMYGLEDGDLSIKYVAKVLRYDVPLTVEGDGIIDVNERKNNKVWGGSKRSTIQTLKTRAEREVFKRWLPVNGAVIYDQDDPPIKAGRWDAPLQHDTALESLESGEKKRTLSSEEFVNVDQENAKVS